MDTSIKTVQQRAMAPIRKNAVSVLYLCSAIAIVSVLAVQPLDAFTSRGELPMVPHPLVQIALAASAAAFVAAAARVYFRRRLGHRMAVIGGLLCLGGLAWAELSGLAWANSWIAFNIPEVDFERTGGPIIYTYARDSTRALAKASILAVVLAVISLVLAAFRELPANWSVRGRAVRERVWPAFAASALVLGLWYGCSVSPYRIPGSMHPPGVPELTILHVEKRGLEIREAAVHVLKDGKFYRWQRTRRLFEHRFTGQESLGGVTSETKLRALALASSLPVSARTPPPKALRAWNAEGWYILGSGRLLSYTSEYRIVPPPEVVKLFKEITASRVYWPHQRYTEKDICLGFCYDPPAALGFACENYHCRTEDDGTTRCP